MARFGRVESAAGSGSGADKARSCGEIALTDLIAGYRSISMIGQGARSIIYHVVKESTGQYFALKRVVRKGPDDQRFIDQVETEYRVSHGVKHDHLRYAVELHRSKKWLQTSQVLLVMEYVPGVTMDQHQPARLDHFLIIFRKVASGLGALHRHGFVHADIKPNNIVLGPEGLVKIIDFGQSCPIGHKKVRIQGTPDYIAPEQVRRLCLDARTDVFNLGATMYWVLTGQTYPTDLPQGYREGVAIVKAKRPLSPKDINDKVPLALSQLIMDCCKRNPNDRPADMRQVESRLKMVQTLWRKKLDELKSKRLTGKRSAGERTASNPRGGGEPPPER
jgi:serine/threonine-protein kinase